MVRSTSFSTRSRRSDGSVGESLESIIVIAHNLVPHDESEEEDALAVAEGVNLAVGPVEHHALFRKGFPFEKQLFHFCRERVEKMLRYIHGR